MGGNNNKTQPQKIFVLNNDDNEFTGTDGNDIIYGREGGDWIDAENGDDVIFGGSGNDTISSDFGRNYLDGGDGHDMVVGGKDNDVIHGGNGHDSLYPSRGDDEVYGGAGDDVVIGHEGNDTIYGGTGNDIIYGDEGDDYLYAGHGNDILDGGDGDDIITTGPGVHYITASKGKDRVLVQQYSSTSKAIFDFSIINKVMSGHVHTIIGHIIDPKRIIFTAEGFKNKHEAELFWENAFASAIKDPRRQRWTVKLYENVQFTLRFGEYIPKLHKNGMGLDHTQFRFMMRSEHAIDARHLLDKKSYLFGYK